jgi:flagellar biosynthesis/type III secretory pathway chaperone
MVDQEQLFQLLKERFAKIEALAKRLIEILLEERTVLEQNNLDALPDLLKEKQKYFHDIDSIQRWQDKLLSDINQKEGLQLTSMKQLIESFDLLHVPQMLSIYERVKDLLDQCQNHNLINGSVIMSQKSHIDSLIELLTQTTSSKTYGSDAQTQLKPRSHFSSTI